MMELSDDQQFCLRWNNFQANITSQFETLRDDEDFTDVTIACDGQRLQAHKVVLSACSPYFKDLFKSNPCSHPIIFMRDVEARHVVALMEFMYAGEVNVAQAHLSSFLKTAESLKIRGLTDTSANFNPTEDALLFNTESASIKSNVGIEKHNKNNNISCSATVTSSQDVRLDNNNPTSPMPSIKRQCKSDLDTIETSINQTDIPKEFENIDDVIDMENITLRNDKNMLPKIELPDYISDDDRDDGRHFFEGDSDITALSGGMDIIPQSSDLNLKDHILLDPGIGRDNRKLHSLEPRPCEECGRVYSNLSNLRQHMKLIHYPTYVSCSLCPKSFKTDLYLRRHMSTSHEHNYKFKNNVALPDNAGRPLRLTRRRNSDHWPIDLHNQSGARSPDVLSHLKESRDKNRNGDKRNRLVKLSDGIEIYEDQLRSVKWSDYRKLTRGLATILFSPDELATCSVTGQRWSRAGSGERPVKPALDRAKVQAIISYVATRFPMVEISRIKQVLAYKCKENSTAFKMKAVRYYGDPNK